MKTVISGEKLWKVEIDATGKFEFVLHGTGKKFNGQLTDSELEQICFRISEVTKSAVTFEPPAQDLVNRHNEDVATLAEQNEKIAELQELLAGREAKTEPPSADVHNVQSEPESEPEPPSYEEEMTAIEKARIEAKKRQEEVSE